MNRPILHLLAPAEHGGLERVVRQLLRAQCDAGRRAAAALIVPEGPHAYEEALRLDGSRALRVRLDGRGYIAARRRLRAMLLDAPDTVVHAHGYAASALVTSLGRRRHVQSLHGFTGGNWRNRLYEWCDLRAARRAAAVVLVAESLRPRTMAAGVTAERLRVVPNAWVPLGELRDRQAARAALGLGESGRPVVGWIGRLSAEKAPDLALEAIARCPGADLAMIGDGPMRAELTTRSEAPDLAGRVRLCGALADAGLLVRAFDMLMLSSHTEGTPMVVLEAMAAHVPVIATAVGGVPALLADGAGHLVPPGDPEALATVVRAWAADPSAADGCADRAVRALAMRDGAAAWVAQHDEAYDQIRGKW